MENTEHREAVVGPTARRQEPSTTRIYDVSEQRQCSDPEHDLRAAAPATHVLCAEVMLFCAEVMLCSEVTLCCAEVTLC